MEPEQTSAPVVTAHDGRRPRDMVVAMVVLLVPIALLLGFYRLVLDGDEPITVDPAAAIGQARAALAFPVAAPVGLDPGDWRVASAGFGRGPDGATLRIGYVGPDEEPILLVQSDVAADRLLPVELGPRPRAGDPVRVGARDWRRYASQRGEAALVLLEPERTIIVIGRADIARLREVAAALP